eukprot:g29678.t1
MWCNENNLSLNICKTKELIIESRKKGGEYGPIYINETEVERLKSIKFIRVTMTNDVSWTSHVNATVKQAQRCLFFLRWLRKFAMFIRSLNNFETNFVADEKDKEENKENIDVTAKDKELDVGKKKLEQHIGEGNIVTAAAAALASAATKAK